MSGGSGGRPAPARAWVGRRYAHLAWPGPFLGPGQIHALDQAVCATAGWEPVERQLTQPTLLRRWARGDGLLVLVVVGWYPLIMTVNANRKAGSAGRAALRRVTDVTAAAGGRAVTDTELADCLRRSHARWAAASAARARLDENRPYLDFRVCRLCSGWSAAQSPHCRSCGHRFTSSDDVARDTRRRAAQEETARAAAELTSLGAGTGLFPDWPEPRRPTLPAITQRKGGDEGHELTGGPDRDGRTMGLGVS